MANEKDQVIDQKEELVEVQETVKTEEVVTEQEPVTSGEQPMEPVEGYVDDFPVTEEALGDLDDKYLREDPMVVGYKSLEEMEIVYDFVASNFDATQESILDVGCGRGDFLTHIQTLYQTDVKYRGVDMNKVLIGVAKEMNPTAEFTATNLFKLDGNYASDWVINIGALSIMYEPAGADFTQMDALKNTVNKMLELADTGIVITLLSANAQDVFDEQYLAYDPVEVLDWALNEYGQLGGNVRLDHSIADSLFTLTIYK
jgi:SAM-dependent methyltransferase